MTDSKPGRRKRSKLLKKEQLGRAIYVDFEGRAVDGEPPVLLGVLLDDSPDFSGLWTFTQYVFDQALRPLADHTGPPAKKAELAPLLNELVDRSEREARQLVCWSTHDRKLILEWSDRTAFRYRNAIKTAKRWRRGRTSIDGGPEVEFKHNDLQSYLKLIGYHVPEDVQEGAGTWIAHVRARLASGKGTVDDMSESGHRNWNRLLEHNRHDCYGMRAVMYRVHGIEPPADTAATS